jgi:hypothetical protein
MRWLLERLFGARLEVETNAYLKGLRSERVRTSRGRAHNLVETLAAAGGQTLSMGLADWGDTVAMPLPEFMRSHAFVSGASGSGKTTFVYDKERSLLDLLPQTRGVGFGVLDAKQDLFDATRSPPIISSPAGPAPIPSSSRSPAPTFFWNCSPARTA